MEETIGDGSVPMNWWEPATPGVLDIGDVSAFLAVLLAFAAVFAGISRLWMKSLRVVIKEEIAVATEPIHPASNGGLSLADVARRTQTMEKSIKSMHKYNQETRNLLLKAMTAGVEIPEHAPEPEVKARSPRSRKKN